MKFFFFVCLFLTPINAFADETSEALNHLSRAVVEVPEVKDSIKRVERIANNVMDKYFFLDKEYASVVFTSSIMAAQGKIDTSAFQNLKVKVSDWEVRPNIAYDFEKNKADAIISTKLNF